MAQDLKSVIAGKNLKCIIKENGYTQDNFAKLITIRRWLV